MGTCRETSLCPARVYTAGEDFKESFVLPPDNSVMPKGHACYWRVNNPEKYTILLEIRQVSGSTKFYIATDINTYAITGSNSLESSQPVIYFLYIANEDITIRTLDMEIKVYKFTIKGYIYICVILGVIAGVFLLAAVFMAIRCCLKCRRRRRDQRAATKLYDKIMKESPELVYNSKSDMEVSKYMQPNCAVCLALFVDGNSIRKLMCQHVFHKECIEGWVKEKIQEDPKCPICKYDLVENQPSEERSAAAMIS
eukprot:TRINITY_DN2261_c0_g1_i10.p1 TRINITY_DN2261_c0_g1~~TRINITY_DN2261_c0_g1_i10.p1  ORF type:complete len:254 (-),score=46.07 TRINITY_DN2261_c0_g1_i10:117-878(-)